MTLKYSLTENDFLQQQLYFASKNDRLKKQRRKSWLINSLAILVLSFLFYDSGNKFLAYWFLGTGILFICFLPFYIKAHHKNHYKKFITETYKNKFGVTSTIKFSDDFIETFDTTGESKTNLSEIEEINETGEYIYLKTKAATVLIIPKSKIENLDALRAELTKIADKLNLKFVSELNWKWK
jgi:hypothetical protein